MRSKTRVVIAAAAAAVMSLPAMAGTIVGQNTVTLWGRDTVVTSWDVRGDVGSDAFFTPEGATFSDGTLYVSADLGLQSRGRLAAYTPGAGGDLSVPAAIQMGPSSNGGAWGPEGLTVNTSGVGYGAFAGGDVRLVSVEATDERAAIINLNQPGVPVTNTMSIPEPDDIAFVSAAWGFALINDLGGGAGQLRRFDVNMQDTGESWALPLGVEGVAAVSADFAERLTGVRPVDDIALLMVAEARDDDNLPSRLLLTDLAGELLAPTMDFSFGLDGSLEAIAVDEETGWIYIGDATARNIHALQIVPAPGGAAAMCAGMLLVRRRR